MLEHGELMAMRKGEDIGLREFRKHVVQYLKGFAGAKAMKNNLMSATTVAQYKEIAEAGKQHALEAASQENTV